MNLRKFENIKVYFKLFALSVFLLIKCNFLFAQKDLTDSAKTYEYWSKRGVIEVVYAYMDDYITTVTDSLLPKEKIKDCTKEKNGLKEYEKQFILPLGKIGINELSSKLNEVSSFLKNNNWSGAEKNVLHPLLIYLNEKNKLNNDFFSTLKPAGDEKSTVIPGYSNKMNNWNKTVEKILSGYNDDLKKFGSKQEAANVTMGDSVEQPILQGNGEPGKPSKVNSINWLVLSLTGILSFVLGVIISFFFLQSKLNSSFDENDSLKRKISEYEKNEIYLKRKVTELEKTVTHPNNSKSETTESKELSSKPEYHPKSIEWDISKEAGNKSISYFSIPENDGRFIIEKGEQTNDGSKYYRIEHRNNSDEGVLFYISGNQDKRAINRLDSYLKPVCDIENIINAESASKIEVLRNGKVIKIADSWVIDTNHKVKIKLI